MKCTIYSPKFPWKRHFFCFAEHKMYLDKKSYLIQVMLLDAETTPIVSLAFAQSALMRQVTCGYLLVTQ